MGFPLRIGKNQYVEWSKIADRPLSYILNREQMKKYLLEKRIKEAESKIEEQLSLEEKIDIQENIKDFINGNRAGKEETELTLEEIKKEYRFINN